MYIEHNPLLSETPRPTLVEPALESLLTQSMLRVEVIAELHRCGSWFHEQPHHHCGLFHLIGTGKCRVHCNGVDAALELEAGDLVILPHGDGHRLSVEDGNCRAEGDARTSMICGELHFPGHGRHPLSHALPTCFVVRAKEAGDLFRQLSDIMVGVVGAGLVGRQVLLNKLADTLFALAVCDYATRATEQRGVFAALADARISRVLQAVHEKPGHGWTMQSLAAHACMSRSAFAERFTQLMKLPPMQYVTQWRVSIAGQMLRERQQSVACIAEQLGYSSEAAFRRLFKRVSGVCPGRLRAEGCGAALH